MSIGSRADFLGQIFMICPLFDLIRAAENLGGIFREDM